MKRRARILIWLIAIILASGLTLMLGGQSWGPLPFDYRHYPAPCPLEYADNCELGDDSAVMWKLWANFAFWEIIFLGGFWFILHRTKKSPPQ